ncbi:putative glycoside hydrolase [Flavivirga aquimarina]|uniref:Glycoside hydrolase n=1 Tax=Flavivirga aquimarina TaxID=2027862 RepID=A0ABT8W5F1_9FLAO|nr:putative glycoside hydrolase [Flavivirga aquimarina]MDO5968341.1 putative glycoside hydrolase [Flavivirga aquimarina]
MFSFSKIKGYVLLFFFVLNSLIANAQIVEPGDWSSIRLYGHAYNVNGFSDDEYDFIANHNYLFTIEKRHARNIYGTPTSEFASGIAAQQIKVNNPLSRPLFYWNSNIVYSSIYESITEALIENPSFVASNGKFNYENADFPDWWVSVPQDQVNNTVHEGVFIDACQNVEATWGADAMPILYNMLDQIPGLVIANGFWPRGNSLLAGLEMIDHVDGVFVEAFFHHNSVTAEQGKVMLDALLEVPENKYIITSSTPDGVWSNDHTFSMACFLIIANDYSFYHFFNGLYGSSETQLWHDDFGKTIGEPLAKATVNEYVYTRVYEYASVSVDLLNRTSSITWIENPKIACRETEDEAIENLALYGTATQSSTLHDGEASRAIDGNTNGLFGNGSVTHTSSENGAWWQVDLGNSYNIGEITVFNRTDANAIARLSNFTIDVLDKDGIIVDSTTYTTYPDPSVTRDAGGVEGRFVKVQINGISSLNLAEVQVAEAVEKIYLASIKVLDSSNNDSISYATLTIDDLVYTSNFTGEIELCLEEGEYPFTLNKDGYNLLNGTLDINSDTNEIFLITPSDLASTESSIADNTDIIADNTDIYPIPVSDILNIKLPSSETAKMSIINSTGQLIISCNIEKGSASVDIRELSAGFYIINISNGNKIYSRNIIVK